MKDATGNKLEVVRVRLLGTFLVSVGRRVIGEDAWRLKKAAALVKLLALAPDHRLHSEQLIEWLWPDLDPVAAANNLRHTLHVARRILDPDPETASRYLRVHDGRLALCPVGTLWVDVEAFEEATRTARRGRESAAYRAAVDLYVGDLLPEDRYEGWAEQRREELRQKHLALLVEIAVLYEEQGELALAIAALRRVVEGDPAHEDAHVGLMRLLAANGRRREAIVQYQQLRRVLSEHLGVEPGESGRVLYEQIIAGQLPDPSPSEGRGVITPAGRSRKDNLPAPRTSFVGREEEMVEVERLLSMTRLLTLVGAGGAGKTRFALKVANNLAGTYQDGAWLVELAPLADGELVGHTVAEAVGVREETDRPLIATLEGHLSSKKLLLILDNCEHLIEAAARLSETLLDSCPDLRVLATSREALNVAGELTWQVVPLSVPDAGLSPTVEKMAGYESVRLFVERASYRQPYFALTQENAEAVAKICRTLDGIPLAIELAAARVGALSVGQIEARLENSLELLTGGRTASPRQRTLEGALDWSLDLLSEKELDLFGRLSVFAGGWTLEAAETVVAGSDVEEDDVLDLLLSLVDKSLVVAEASGDVELRYRMLEPVRQYSSERLKASREAERVQKRHAEYYLALAERAEPELKGAWQEVWFKRLETERSNLRAALSWALDPADVQSEERAELGLRLTVALWLFWNVHSLGEDRRWLETALNNSGARSAARAKVLNGAGWTAVGRGDYDRAIAMFEESRASFVERGDRTGAATSLAYLGMAVLRQGDSERVKALCDEAEVLRWEPLDRRAISQLLSFLGAATWYEGDYHRAVALFEENLALSRELEDTRGIAQSIGSLGIVALGHGDHDRAAALLKDALRPFWELKDRPGMAFSLLGLAGVASFQGRAARAARLWGAAEVLREAIGFTLSSYDRSHYDYEGRLAAARSQLDEIPWTQAWQEGRTMTPEQAVEYALSTEEPEITEPRDPLASLTRREREIATLLARDLTNRQIAEELVISEHTAATHVRRILKKLGLRSRTEIASRLAE